MALTWLAGASCAVFGADAVDGSAATDAGATDSGATDGALEASAADGSPADADADATDGGCIARPSAVAMLIPDGSFGVVCNAGNAIEPDGQLAGLDTTGGGPSTGTIAGEVVDGCLEARFDVDVGGRLVIDARSVISGCASSCFTECKSAGRIKVFAGPSQDALSYVGLITLEADAGITPYSLFLPSTPSRVVAVCKGPVSTSLIDPAVDAIRADCL